jgi:hypothetical protein
MPRTHHTRRTNPGIRAKDNRHVKTQYAKDKTSNSALAPLDGESFTPQGEDALEKVGKYLHMSCGNIEYILVRVIVFGFFLYGLGRVAYAVFMSHP